jgi:hypothetical protein
MPGEVQIIPLPLPGLAVSRESMDRIDEIYDWLTKTHGDVSAVVFIGIKLGRDLVHLGYEGSSKEDVRYAIYGMSDLGLALRLKLTFG